MDVIEFECVCLFLCKGWETFRDWGCRAHSLGTKARMSIYRTLVETVAVTVTVAVAIAAAVGTQISIYIYRLLVGGFVAVVIVVLTLQ